MEERIRIYQYATHVVPLAMALEVTDGNVLEIGVGTVSTHLLHYLLFATKPQRELVSLEDGDKWAEAFMGYRTEWHSIRHSRDFFKALDVVGCEWGLAFIDNGQVGEDGTCPTEEFAKREGLVRRLKEKTKVIVVHDNHVMEELPGWKELVREFKYSWEYLAEAPSTIVLSDVIDIGEEFRKMITFGEEISKGVQ